jgi:hypothetical protein
MLEFERGVVQVLMDQTIAAPISGTLDDEPL